MAQNTQTTGAGGALTQQQVADLLLQPLGAAIADDDTVFGELTLLPRRSRP